MEKQKEKKFVCRKLSTGETYFVSAGEYEKVKDRIETPGKRLLLREK